jgi:hypothetical protein
MLKTDSGWYETWTTVKLLPVRFNVIVAGSTSNQGLPIVHFSA